MKDERFRQLMSRAREQLASLERSSVAEDSPVAKEAVEQLANALEELHVAEEELGAANDRVTAGREQIENERNRFRQLFEAVPDGYIVTGIDGIIRYASLSAARLLGVPTTTLVGKPLAVFVSSSHRRLFRTELGRLPSSGRRDGLELLLHPRGGAPFLASTTASVMRDHRAQIESIGWLFQDITQRKEIESAEAARANLTALSAEVGSALGLAADQRTMLQACAEAIVRHLDAAFGRIWTLDERTQTLELQASAGMYTHVDGSHSRIPLGQLEIGRIAREQRPHLSNAVIGDPLVHDQEWARREGLVAFAGHPLLLGDRLVGVVALFARRPLPETTLDTLAPLSSEIALGIERRRAEDALRSSEERLRRLVEAMPDAIVIADYDGRIVLVNAQTERLFGYQKAELVGERIEILVPRHLHDPHVRHRAQYFGEPTVRPMGVGLELHGRRRDGFEFPVEISLSPIETPEGRLVTAAIRDITQRRRAEEALRESEARLRDVASNLPGVAYQVLQKKGSFSVLFITDSPYLELLGVTAEELRRDPATGVRRIVAEDLKEIYRRLSDPRVTSEPSAMEFRTRSAADDIRWFRVASMPRRLDDGDTLHTGLMFDVTLQKRAELRLAIQYEMTRILSQADSFAGAAPALLNKLAEGFGCDIGELWTMTPDGRFEATAEWHSPAANTGRFLEVSRATTFERGDGLIGRVVASRQTLWCPDLTKEPSFQRAAVASEVGLRRCIAIPIQAEGGVVAVIILFARSCPPPDPEWLMLLDATGRQIGSFIDRKTAQRSLEVLSGTLMQLQDQERRRIGRELHDSTAQKLAGVAMNLSLVQRAAKRLEAGERRALAEGTALVQECSQEIRTISYLLHPPLLDEIGLASAVRGYADGFSKRSGIRVDVEVSPQLGRLPQATELALFRVVQECLTNVHRHAGSGKVRIDIARDAEGVSLEVEDDGRGMPSDVSESAAEPGLGSGVGVMGMRERMRQLGGSLRIHSSRKGTTVEATLPLPKD